MGGRPKLTAASDTLGALRGENTAICADPATGILPTFGAVARKRVWGPTLEGVQQGLGGGRGGIRAKCVRRRAVGRREHGEAVVDPESAERQRGGRDDHA